MTDPQPYAELREAVARGVETNAVVRPCDPAAVAALLAERDALIERQIPEGWEVEWHFAFCETCGLPGCADTLRPVLGPAPSPDTEEG